MIGSGFGSKEGRVWKDDCYRPDMTSFHVPAVLSIVCLFYERQLTGRWSGRGPQVLLRVGSVPKYRHRRWVRTGNVGLPAKNGLAPEPRSSLKLSSGRKF